MNRAMNPNPSRSRPTALLILAMTAAFIGMPQPVYGWGWRWESEYRQVVSERDQARKERDEAIAARIDDLKKPESLDPLIETLKQQLDDARHAASAALARTEAEQTNSGKWRSFAFAGTASCLIVGMVVGLAIGTKARRDHRAQQTATAAVAALTADEG